MSKASTIPTSDRTTMMSAALGTPRDYDHLFAGVVSAVLAPASAGITAASAASAVATATAAEGARKWARPLRGIPR